MAEKSTIPANILSFDAYVEGQKKADAPKIVRRQNVSLNKGGSVDICTTTQGEVLAVVRFAEINSETINEIQPLIQKAEAKAVKPQLTAAMPEGVQGVSAPAK